MQTIEVCLCQVFRPKDRLPTDASRGDCTICSPDPENNKNCSGYYPIRLVTVEINKEYEHTS
ncbi:MAG: hypothetical protein AABW63_00215 [Nanoarchaeota archaeon]